jgi:hypothetical protein
MSYFKDLSADICALYHKGYAPLLIANLLDVTEDEVDRVLQEQYNPTDFN